MPMRQCHLTRTEPCEPATLRESLAGLRCSTALVRLSAIRNRYLAIPTLADSSECLPGLSRARFPYASREMFWHWEGTPLLRVCGSQSGPAESADQSRSTRLRLAAVSRRRPG